MKFFQCGKLFDPEGPRTECTTLESNMTKKYQVTDSRGKVHKRTTKSNTYTHAVVHHIKAQPAEGNWAGRPAYSRAEWAGSLTLAQNAARRWVGVPYCEGVEILEAQEA
jgi:hypothetical protein